ncbi:augurin-A [Misgurnus anguillicaudatus]|uniref:augurin-A n=1 Tax=Misgurnus anguillicaudatus TaxID=75329 RepID=UPI003CCFC12C
MQKVSTENVRMGCIWGSCLHPSPLCPSCTFEQIEGRGRREIMTAQKISMLAFVTLLTFLALSVASENTLGKILMRKVDGDVNPSVALTPSKAKQFLASLKRPKRNLWDRSRPDVQQWIQQFMYMGYDEARLETDLAYWMDHYRSNDQGRQHHYDENSPMGPRGPGSYRHGADVNYDYY